MSNSVEWCLRIIDWTLLHSILVTVFPSEAFSFEGGQKKKKWMSGLKRILMFCLCVCLSVCLDRRLLCGLPGPHAQRRPLRSQKDVCQQRPGPECLQEGDHHHGENSDALFQASSLTSGCLNLLVCRHLRQRAHCLKDSFAKWLTIKGLCYKILRRNNSVCLWLVIEPPSDEKNPSFSSFDAALSENVQWNAHLPEISVALEYCLIVASFPSLSNYEGQTKQLRGQFLMWRAGNTGLNIVATVFCKCTVLYTSADA